MKKLGLILSILVTVSLFYGGFALNAGGNTGMSQGGDLIAPLATEEPTPKPTATPKPTSTPKPIVFALKSPKNNSYIRDVTTATRFEWYEEPLALEYTFSLVQISTNTRALGPIHTETVGTDVCVQKICSLDYDLAEADSGLYSWTIEAVTPTDESLEPSNAAFVFTLNVEPIELLSNGGFDEPVTNPSAANPSSWKRINPSGERRECREDKLPVGVSGLCAYKSTTGPVATLSQAVASSLLNKLKIGGGDTLTVNASVQAVSAVSAKSKLRILLQFANGSKQTINAPLDAASGDIFAAITPKSTDLGQNKPAVTKMTVQVVSANKFFIDDVSVILEPIEAVLLLPDAAPAVDLRGQ